MNGEPSRLLGETEQRAFREQGFIVLRGFYDLERDLAPIQRGIRSVIAEVMRRHGVADTRQSALASDFDEGYLEFIAGDRGRGAEVYDAVKQVPAFVRLVADARHERLMAELRPGAVPGIAAGGSGIRIDNPHETRFRAQWHQEYPAQLRSIDGLVLWSPLVPVTDDLGPVQICTGSHRKGALPVRVRSDGSRSGAYALELADEEGAMADHSVVAPLVVPGDLVLLDFLTVHASGHNTGRRSRWSMQFRYFNFADTVGRAHGWKGSFAAGVDFRDIHPELSVR